MNAFRALLIDYSATSGARSIAPKTSSTAHVQQKENILSQIPNSVLSHINETHNELSRTRFALSELREGLRTNARLTLTPANRQALSKEQNALKVLITDNEKILCKLEKQLHDQITPYASMILHSEHAALTRKREALENLKPFQTKLISVLQRNKDFAKYIIKHSNNSYVHTHSLEVLDISGLANILDNTFSTSDRVTIIMRIGLLKAAAKKLGKFQGSSLVYQPETLTPAIHENLSKLKSIVDKQITRLSTSLRILEDTESRIYGQILQKAIDNHSAKAND